VYAPLINNTRNTTITYDPVALKLGTTVDSWVAVAIVDQQLYYWQSNLLRSTYSEFLSIRCPTLFYGQYCGDRQNLTASIISGYVSIAVALLFTILVIWSEWPDRTAEVVRKGITERAVTIAR